MALELPWEALAASAPADFPLPLLSDIYTLVKNDRLVAANAVLSRLMRQLREEEVRQQSIPPAKTCCDLGASHDRIVRCVDVYDPTER
jgi:hypothetical protein